LFSAYCVIAGIGRMDLGADMKDYKNNEYSLEMSRISGCGNRLSVMLMLVSFVVPNLIFMVIG